MLCRFLLCLSITVAEGEQGRLPALHGPSSQHSSWCTLAHAQVVPPGSNGAVSLLGCAAGAACGALMGAVFYLAQLADARLGLLPCSPSPTCLASAALALLAAATAGLLGSLLDSLLGATLQYSGVDRRTGKATSAPPRGPAEAGWVSHTSGRDWLSNSQVNVVSSLATSLAAAAAAHAWRAGPACP